MKGFLGFLSVVIIVYGLGNYYVGMRGWQFASRLLPRSIGWVYWTVFWAVASSYIIGAFGTRMTDIPIAKFFNNIGSIWMAGALYFIILLFLIDIFRFIIIKFGSNNLINLITSNKVVISTGVAVIFIVISVLVLGFINIKFPTINEYDIAINKKASIQKLNAVLLSDIHLGHGVGRDDLENMVEMVNELNPDIVLLAGDIIDGDLNPVIKMNAKEEFLKIKSKYGVYAVLGNHEYYGRGVEGAVSYLTESGIKVLVDDFEVVDDSFVVVGRDDKAGERFNINRKSLKSIMLSVDKKLPIIMMDHQPYNLNETVEAGVDLQLSGHTHNGQLFPFNFITSKIYELDWGYMKKGETNFVVSSGYGFWGPPFRTVNRSEIVKLNITFE